MLWTDQDPVTVNDLTAIDPEVSRVASAEEIVMDGAVGVLRLATEEAGSILEGKMISFGNYLSQFDVSANHMAAVFYTGGMATQKSKMTLEQVVMNGRNSGYRSELKLWVCHYALMVFYRAAMSRPNGDRYEHKYDRERWLLEREFWPAMKRRGIPLVYRPLPMPGASQGFATPNPETWALTSVAGAGTSTASFTGAVSFVCIDGAHYVAPTNPGNGESSPSVPSAPTTLTSGHVLQFDITNLHPSVATLSDFLRGRGYTVPLATTHWNAYVADSNGIMWLQNSTPIAIATKTYTLSGNPVLTGYRAGLGQFPESFLTISDVVQRG